MKQRRIIVPKDKSAEDLLEYDQAEQQRLLEFKLNDEDFLLLYESGLFSLINDLAEVNIDDYEDDRIKDIEALKKVHEMLESKISIQNQVNESLLKEISKLFEEALRRNTGVYFYF